MRPYFAAMQVSAGGTADQSRSYIVSGAACAIGSPVAQANTMSVQRVDVDGAACAIGSLGSGVVSQEYFTVSLFFTLDDTIYLYTLEV